MKGNMINRLVALSLFLAVSIAPRASAQAARVFLSGTGSDSGDCSNAATPCRSLQGAINQAAAGAEVVIVSSGGYGGATITKSITVNAPTGVIAFVGRTITVTIAGTDTVTLRGLSMNGTVFADALGIAFTAGGTLNVENTVISSFSETGINDAAAGSKLWVHNCDVKKNGYAGIYVLGASAVIENSRAVENTQAGVFADSSSTVTVRNSVAEGNVSGFLAIAGGGAATELVVDSCMATNNGVGLQSNQSGTGSAAILRAGQNVVMNNGTNLSTNGGSLMISQGGNRIGGATGGTTGFTSTVGQQNKKEGV